jgi:hypothetical protein
MLTEKKKSLEKSLIFLGWLNLPPKFDIELLSLFTKHKLIIMYKKVLASISYFLSEIPLIISATGIVLQSLFKNSGFR